MKRLMVLLFPVLIGIACARFGYAGNEGESSFSQRLRTLEEKVEEMKAEVEASAGLKISGFVDTSLFYDDNAGASTFSLDEVEIDLLKELSAGLSVRADLNYRNADGDLEFDEILEQGYLTFRLPFAESLDFSFGKFNAPIGFELLDPVDMYQFSHALVFNLGIPTNVTGIMLTAKPTGSVDFNLYLVNGWDLLSDNNRDKTVGARVGFTPLETFSFGVSAIHGAERANQEGDKRFVLDLDATLNLPGSTTAGLEVNYGMEENLPASLPASGQDVEWFGFLIMVHRDFTDWLGVTLRYDFFDDKDGGRTGRVQQLQAATAALTFSLGEGAGALLEYRHDWSDVNSFTLASGAAADSNDSLALELTYSF